MGQQLYRQTCTVCGVEYQKKYLSKSCSHACANKLTNEAKLKQPREIICAQCGKPFTRHRQEKTCSRQCAHDYRVKQITIAHQSKTTGTTFICLLCKKVCEKKIPEQIYCSQKCRKKKYTVLNGIRYTKKCEECGAEKREPCRDDDDEPTDICEGRI